MAICHAHTHGFALFDQDLSHVGVGEHVTTAGLNHRDDGFGNFRGTAYRVETTVQVMLGNERVHHEARLFRGGYPPAIAPPLTGNGANQLFVGGEFPQYVIGGAVETVRQYCFQPSGNQWRSQRGREFGQGIPLHAIGTLPSSAR